MKFLLITLLFTAGFANADVNALKFEEKSKALESQCSEHG